MHSVLLRDKWANNFSFWSGFGSEMSSDNSSGPDLKQAFLTSTLLTFGVEKFFVVCGDGGQGHSLAHCKIFSSISGLYTLDASSTLPTAHQPLTRKNQKRLHILSNVPQNHLSLPVENHCFKISKDRLNFLPDVCFLWRFNFLSLFNQNGLSTCHEQVHRTMLHAGRRFCPDFFLV